MARAPIDYGDREDIARRVAAGEHRKIIGDLWDEVGKLQFAFLCDAGLKPSSRLLDIGCGSLRGGVHFAEYLDAGNYFGTDINQSLLDAGFEIELQARNLQGKVPRANLICDGEFRFSRFRTQFDFAIAQSLFTHLSADRLQMCLANLAPWMVPGSRFFATFFLVPDDHPFGEPFKHSHRGIRTFEDCNPYHYRKRVIRDCCTGLPWSATIIGEWKHPRDQQMVLFTLQDLQRQR